MRLLLFVVVGMLLLAGAPVSSVVIDSGDGTGNTTAPGDDPGWDRQGTRSGLTVIYVGNHWILTAAHIPFGDVTIGGVSYSGVANSRVKIGSADLAVWQLESAPDLPLLPIRANVPGVGDEILLIGHGLSRDANTFTCGSLTGYDTGSPKTMRWGTNEVEAVGFDVRLGGSTTRSFNSKFDKPPPGPDNRCQAGVDCPEAQVATGDSGGAVYIKNGQEWELAGVIYVAASMLKTKEKLRTATAPTPTGSVTPVTTARSRPTSSRSIPMAISSATPATEISTTTDRFGPATLSSSAVLSTRLWVTLSTFRPWTWTPMERSMPWISCTSANISQAPRVHRGWFLKAFAARSPTGASQFGPGLGTLLTPEI